LAWKDRIAVDPDVLAGKPVLKGTRIAVEFIVGLLADGWTYETILRNYPQLNKRRHTRSAQLRQRHLERRKGLPFGVAKRNQFLANENIPELRTSRAAMQAERSSECSDKIIRDSLNIPVR
jgi:hypothetical protein